MTSVGVGGRSHERKGNPERQATAARKLAEAERRLAALLALREKTPEAKDEIRQVRAQVAHWRTKSREKSETHSRRGKGPR